MARRKRDPAKQAAAYIAARGLVQVTPIHNRRFVVRSDKGHHVATIDAKAPAGVRLSKPRTLMTARAEVTRAPVDIVAAWCEVSRWKVGSNLHGDHFVVSRPAPYGARAWHVARLAGNTVEVVTKKPAPLRGGALALVERQGSRSPTASLEGAPAHPVLLYAERIG